MGNFYRKCSASYAGNTEHNKKIYFGFVECKEEGLSPLCGVQSQGRTLKSRPVLIMSLLKLQDTHIVSLTTPVGVATWFFISVISL
jgi:hypothetical protein